MALNTGGFTLGVMPEAPRGVENLGRFDVGQVLAASRAGAENVEQAFNTPFRVQQEIAKTQTAKAQSDIAKAQAANAPALLEAQLAGQRESVKSNILANKLSSNTLEAKTKLTQTQADLSAAELAFTNETSPIKKQALQANLDTLRAKADTDKAEYDAALSADFFAAQAGVKAGMARAGTKALAGFDESGTRTITDATGRPLAVQTLTPTADGASVSSIAIPQTQVVGTQTEPLRDENGKDIVDPRTGGKMMQRYNILASGARAPVGAPIVSMVEDEIVKEGSPLAPLKDYVLPYSSDQASRNAEIASETKSTSTLTQKKNALQNLKAQGLEFIKFNEKEETGPIQGSVQKLLSLKGTSEATKEMASIESSMNAFSEALKGQGTVTDNEREMLRRALPSISKDVYSNRAFVNFIDSMLKQATEKQKFFNQWKRNGMGQLAGAEQVWNDYVSEVPDLSVPLEKWVENRNATTKTHDAVTPTTGVQTTHPAVKTGPTKAPRVIQNGVTFVLQPDGVTYLPE